MSDNQQIQNSSKSSNQSTDHIEDAFQGLKVHENQDFLVRSSPNSGHTGERDCSYYLRTGMCAYGNNCRFNHPTYVEQGVIYYKDELPERVGQPDCEYFLKTGTCKYGSTCKYHHPKDRNGAGPVSFNILGFPMRQGEKSCPYYMRNGTCKFGVACKFHHPPPSSHGNAIPVSGPSIFPQLNLPYIGGFTTLSLPTATFGSGPLLQDSQTYMPVMVSPSGIFPPQGWNTYMANLSSTYTGVSNLMYDSKNQANSSSGSQVPVMATSAQNLPERPDQPECRHFMNTGTCRYGAGCKYHHPKERMSPLSSTTLNPFALPSRPGQPICSNFITSGFCKFGPNCKYDHSFVAYPYNYSLTVPPISTYGTTVFAYPRSSQTNHVSETSLSQLKNSDTITGPDEPNPNAKDGSFEVKNTDDSSEGADSQLQVSSEEFHDLSG